MTSGVVGCGADHRRTPAFARTDGDWACQEVPTAERRRYVLPVAVVNAGDIDKVLAAVPLRSTNVRVERVILEANIPTNVDRHPNEATLLTVPATVPKTGPFLRLEIEFDAIDRAKPAGIVGAHITYEVDGRVATVDKSEFMVMLRTTPLPGSATTLCAEAVSEDPTTPLLLDETPQQPPARM